MTASVLTWYVVRTRPNAEQLAITHLQRQGFQAYMPRYLKFRRHARKVERVARPLFPGYLFVALDVARDRWRAIQSTTGVSQMLCHGDAPVPVPKGIVEALQGQHDEAGLVRLSASTAFKPGNAVRLLEGAFAASIGLFEAMADGDRVAILLDMLGRKVRILAPADSIELAS